jgi:catechol 2,3-dioxygenase-like lactoylglutathione lyase family enzyme
MGEAKVGTERFAAVSAPEQLLLKVVIRCRDYKRSRKFYRELLGLPVLHEWTEDEGKGCIFGFGGLEDGSRSMR